MLQTKRCAFTLAVFASMSAYGNFGDPLPGLTSQQTQDFQAGKAKFIKVDNPADDGLGPIFNEASCATCHTGPAGTAAANAIGGTTERPDGSTYHITWSLAPGRRAWESNPVIARSGWSRLPQPIPIRLEPRPFGG